MEDYYDDVKMPGSRLNIRFDSHYGDRKASEQVFMIPFREGDDVKYFVVRGVCEGDRRVTGCDIIRIMDWDRLIKYLGEVWDEMWGAMLFKLKAADAVEPRLIIDDVGCIWRVGSVMQGGMERMDEELVKEFWRLMKDKDVNKFLLAAFIEWVRKTRKEGLRDNRGRSH